MHIYEEKLMIGYVRKKRKHDASDGLAKGLVSILVTIWWLAVYIARKQSLCIVNMQLGSQCDYARSAC